MIAGKANIIAKTFVSPRFLVTKTNRFRHEISCSVQILTIGTIGADPDQSEQSRASGLTLFSTLFASLYELLLHLKK